MSGTSPRTSFDSTATTSAVQRPLIPGAGSKKPSSSAVSKIKSAFKKLKPHSEDPAEGSEDGEKQEKKKSSVPKSVKEGSFGGEASHMRMQ